MISQEHTDLLMQVAKAVGRKLARQYPAMDAEDVASEVTTQALAEWKHIKAKLDKAAAYDRTEYEVLHFLLSQRANAYCGKQQYEYMLHSSQAIYTPKEVRALLKEAYYNPDAYTTPGKEDQVGVAVESKDLWVNLADINRALDSVPARVHDVILAAFGPEDLGLPEPDRRRTSDAVNTVTRELNKHLNHSRSAHQGPGARRALTNSAAQAITNNQEDIA
ncbi:hypothetical protein AB0G06_43410 [Nonomuraea dietziae]|uniref:hypothetical protein n=1 Tax=Nonomuraea dietziae TaxID=65515 RepID=UPI0033D2A35F